MKPVFTIHPSIGIARLGNSETDFYLTPLSIGGLPIECDLHGNEQTANTKFKEVDQFKDASGHVKRQAQKFRIYKKEGDKKKEVTLASDEIKNMEWTVHVANKKAAWYDFSMLLGNTMYNQPGLDNSYKARGVHMRNKKVKTGRQKLIIDPGPRNISGKNASVEISANTIPDGYKFGSFPGKTKFGFDITRLGDLKTDAEGRLVVLGGLGRAGGNNPIKSFAGADERFDDISDGIVQCKLTLKDGSTEVLQAWIIVGSPKFAPEVDNICTLSDTMLDVAIRYQNLVPQAYDENKWNKTGGWNPDHEVNYYRDVLPLLQRPKKYQWVANVQPMLAFASASFDFSDKGERNKKNRERYVSYFRKPDFFKGEREILFGSSHVPLMPLNSGSNSVSNDLVDKFLAVTETQYYFLQQWAEGKFNLGADVNFPGVFPEDQATVGNCVGLPMCPGIEVTWNLQNPALYEGPYRIKHRHTADYLWAHGLSDAEDETDGLGCEPGDLTKRMAIPWQADFFDCTVQLVNFTNPKVNFDDNGPVSPTYYAYWWPPQSPWDVISGAMTPQEQEVSGNPAGVQVNFARGINNFSQMIQAWSYMGFILNQNQAEDRDSFPFFTERERNHDKFTVTSIAVSRVSHNKNDELSVPIYFLKEEHAAMIAKSVEDEAFTPIVTETFNDVPRSGTRIRY